MNQHTGTSLINFFVRTAFVVGALAATASAQIQFDRPKAEKPLPNPSIIAAQRDETVTATKQMLETREVSIDKEDCNQLTGECTIITKPVIFIKGITTRSQLEHYCEVPAANVKNWTKGRYVLRIQIAPASPKTAQVGIYAKFEGMTDGFSGNEWVQLTSKGELEDKFLRCIKDRTTGGDCKNIFEKER
ncbi:MAG: hypothetical protein HY231_15080 [Acidobacteria bacterium]|nr:hypothetical protein [Acidobacteriota bacterium]